MPCLNPRLHDCLRLVMGMMFVAGAACDPAAVHRLARDIAKDGKTAPPNPGPGPAYCYADEDCDGDLVCSVSLGDCARPPDCDADGACPDVCTGKCVAGESPVEDPCASVRCAEGTACVVLKSNPPQASCQPIENPCAATLCPVGSECVVLESFPPQAKCVAVETPRSCYASTDCPADESCSTERGDCQPPPGCADGRPCPAVCTGVCEPVAAPAQCRSDADCTMYSNYCDGCSCEAASDEGAIPVCSNPVQCLIDPCEGKRAVCEAGKCTVATRANRCETEVMGGDTSCKPAEVWKRYVTEACDGGEVTAMGFGRSCEGGNHREVKYTCWPVARVPIC